MAEPIQSVTGRLVTVASERARLGGTSTRMALAPAIDHKKE